MKKLQIFCSQFFLPTLIRRLVFSSIIAFGLTWIVLIVYLYQANQKRIIEDMSAWCDSMIFVIAEIKDVDTARDVLRAVLERTNAGRRKINMHEPILAQLSDRSGTRLFLSAAAEKLEIPGATNQITNITINGKAFWIVKKESPQWSLILAVPQYNVPWTLTRINGDLIIDMLIGFPFIFLPILIALSRGLRPLQRLSNRISSRGPDDLSPLDIDPKYGELKPLTFALDNLLAQLRIKIARENTFVQDAAHELRTPLAVISAQAHVLMKASGQEQRMEAEQRLDRAIERASHLIQQLLELAHIESNHIPDIRTMDIAQLVRQELALIAPAAMTRDLELSLTAPDTLFHALEVHAFQSILQNLLTNALRYVQSGGRVVVTLQMQQDILTLSVADNGPGIPESEMTMIFERFYRGVGHDVSGSGLGLSIVKQAAARLHGTVRLISGLDGKGCEFVVDIPVESQRVP